MAFHLPVFTCTLSQQSALTDVQARQGTATLRGTRSGRAATSSLAAANFVNDVHQTLLAVTRHCLVSSSDHLHPAATPRRANLATHFLCAQA